MHEPLPPGGLIRKLWISEAEAYRDHLLRLDPDSRRNRFAGAVSDQFVTDYANLSFGIDAVIHGFFVDGTLRGAAELRPIGAPITREAVKHFMSHEWALTPEDVMIRRSSWQSYMRDSDTQSAQVASWMQELAATDGATRR